MAVGERRNGVVLKLPPMSVIAGRVLDESGEPVMDLKVIALRPRYENGRRQWSEFSSGITSDRGEFRIPRLPAGGYLVKTVARNSALVSSTMRLTQPLPETPETIYAATYYPGASDEGIRCRTCPGWNGS